VRFLGGVRRQYGIAAANTPAPAPNEGGKVCRGIHAASRKGDGRNAATRRANRRIPPFSIWHAPCFDLGKPERAMENALFVGLSRQVALGREMQVIANNLANANTSGFKAESIVFHTDYQPDQGDAIGRGQPIAYVADHGLSRSLDEGELTATGNPLDVAVGGEGYLTVQTAAGDRYTRDGHLHTDATGQLVTGSGDAVLDDSGRPITLQPEDGRPTIATDGTISAANGKVAKLKVVDFADATALQRQGGGLLWSDQQPIPATKARIMQGMLEGSNVQPILQMTRMIDVLRAYQANATLMQTNNDLIRRAVDTLGNVQA
jgi:flagellar basal-body rod protein FlgF